MPVAVTAAEIANRWRPLTDAEAATIGGKSEDAWTRILASVPGIEAHLEAADVSEATVKSVMISMIVRVLKNPDSARTIQQSIDDSSESRTLDNAVSTGELYLTDFEIGLLTPATSIPSYGMYVIGLGEP
jgi:hypothetical protein